MPGLRKVGLTTNPIETRVQQLSSTTSVPSPFKLERLFELETRFLLSAERLIHRKLREQGTHCGKEFFRVDLQTCTTLVQDVIYELTGSTLRDLVGAAQERAARAAASAEVARQEMAERERRLEELNEGVRRQREDWMRSVRLRQNPPPKHPKLEKLLDLGAFLVGIPISIFFVLAIFSVTGPVGIVVGALFLWWIISKEEKDGRLADAELERKALGLFPPEKLEDVPATRPAPQSSKAHFRSGSATSSNPSTDVGASQNNRVTGKYGSDTRTRARSSSQCGAKSQDPLKGPQVSATACPYCSQWLRLPRGIRGRATCPRCRGVFYVNRTFATPESQGRTSQEAPELAGVARNLPCGSCGRLLRIPNDRRGLGACPTCNSKTLFSATES